MYGSNFCKDGINLKNADKNTDKTSVKSDFSINAIAKNINEIGEFYIDVVSKNIIESIFKNYKTFIIIILIKVSLCLTEFCVIKIKSFF